MTEEHPAPERVRIRFTPSDKEVRVPTGVPVFDAASWNGIAIDSTCGGHGTCKKCKVQITEGAIPPVQSLDRRAFSQEQLDDGWRLACVARTSGDLVVDVPSAHDPPQGINLRGRTPGHHCGRRCQKRFVQLTEPTLHRTNAPTRSASSTSSTTLSSRSTSTSTGPLARRCVSPTSKSRSVLLRVR